jgi:uncharacterized tellurite resistance protein B-like protein
MANFFSRSAASSLSPEDAGMTAAVFTLILTGDFNDLDKRCIGLFRDQFFRLSPLDEAAFQQLMDAAVVRIQTNNYAANIAGFVPAVLIPHLPTPEDRLGVYRYVYSLAMTDLNINDNENALMQAMRQHFGIEPAQFDAVEQAALNEFMTLFRAIAATALGLMIVTADGSANAQELENIRAARSVLEPIGKLDDVQFELVYELSLVVHDRFLLDIQQRKDFMNNIVAHLLSSREVRYQAFRYAASISTADGDIAQAELNMLQEVMTALGIRDEVGDQLMNEFMGRIRTIDGKPRQ